MKDNYNIKINPPELSSEQINQHQDFDALLASFEQTAGASKEPTTVSADTTTMKVVKRRRRYITGIIATLAAASLVFIIFKDSLVPVPTYAPPLAQLNELLTLQSPLPNLALPPETKTMQAEIGETLTYASGSKVKIPAAAFVDKTGEPVKGAVEITYREFNDPVDMFLAGIPKELNKHQDLRSTGMMEIKGFQNGEPVYLNMNKTLDIELKGKMATDLEPDDLGVYVYSNQEDAWNYQTKDQVEILNDAINNNPNTNANNSTPDSPELAPIIAQLQHEKQASKPVPPIRPGVPNDMQVFDFELDLENAPELKQYDQKIDFMASVEVFTPATFDTIWSDMALTKSTDGNYILTLEHENEQGEVTKKVSKVEPVVVATDEAKAQFEIEQAKYEQALEAWETEILALAQEEVVEESLVNIVNRFEIQRFGLWNCGKPVEWKAQETVPTQFVDLEGAPMELQEVFVAAQEQQFYYSAPSDQSSSNIPLPSDNQLKQKIWAMSAKGDLLVAEVFHETAEPDPSKSILFMKPVAIPNSAADLRTLLTL
ncbi:MAG: hypothetical protein AB8E82_07880 [Aureispira sp.]